MKSECKIKELESEVSPSMRREWIEIDALQWL